MGAILVCRYTYSAVYCTNTLEKYDSYVIVKTSSCNSLPHQNVAIKIDEDGIRTHAGIAQWISSPSP